MRKKTLWALVLLVAGAAFVDRARAQRVNVDGEITATRESLALRYPEGPTISVKFQGTYRLPQASGEAKVERKRGMTEIEIELDEIKPASFFGGDYNTYVLWVASPESHVDNIGEFILQGNRSKLNVSTPLETFGMFITAEPHFLVESPSRFVVLENTRPTRDIAPIKVSQIRYKGFEGVYNYSNESLANFPEGKGEQRTHVDAARTAVELAERVGAAEYAPEELNKAREALRSAEMAEASGSSGRNLMLAGHEAIRLAVDAQKLAEQRTFDAALKAERDSHAAETSRMEQAISQAASEAERARLEAERRQMQLEMEQRASEQAMLEAREAARRAADAEARAGQLAVAKSEAELDAQRARQEASDAQRDREEAHERLRHALGAVVEIRETARGLIVNLPNILFDFNKATLKPQAREILSKVSGILLVAEGYQLRVEGHTDNIGSDEYNQGLSEERARSVLDFLVQNGVSASIISSVGHGESQPIAGNDTDEGRQKNRRVEIHVEETALFRIRID